MDGKDPQGTPLIDLYGMVCHYSRRRPVSSEKHETPFEVEVRGRGGDTSGVAIAAGVIGGHDPLMECPAVVSRAAKVAKT
jgi:hypothetical protein